MGGANTWLCVVVDTVRERKKNMANGEAFVTITGTLMDTPSCRYTTSGVPVTNMRIETGECVMPCVIFGEAAETLCGAYMRGASVVATGFLRENKHKEHTEMQMVIDTVGLAPV